MTDTTEQLSNENRNMRHELQAMAHSRDQMNVKIARLTGERDESLAQVAALREALEAALAKITEHIAASGGLYGLEVRATRVAVGEILDNAMSQPNPGAALLERLRAAEAELEAVRKAMRADLGCDLVSLATTLSAIADEQEAVHERLKAAEAVCEAATAWQDDGQARSFWSLDAAISNWRKLTENRNET